MCANTSATCPTASSVRSIRTPFFICLVASLLAASACTSLGPMPGMTMANAVPDPRPGAEVQFALVPGFRLSEGVKENVDKGHPMPQSSVWLEPGVLLDKGRGLGFGMRLVGGDDDHWVEPMLRYRTFIDDHKRLAVTGVVYGTAASGEEKRATYDMMRLGGEFGVDVRVTPVHRWVELHLTGGASITGLWANGTYCMNKDTGYGRDCDMDKDDPPDAKVSAETALPGFFVGAHVDLARDVPYIQGIRLGLVMAGGTQPAFKDGQPRADQPWFSYGAQASVAFGASKPD